MTIRLIYESGVNGETTDITDYLPLYSFDMTEYAEEGSVALSELTLDDPNGELDIVGWRRTWAYEDTATGSNSLIHYGWIGDKQVQRGASGRTGSGRLWTVKVADQNVVLGFRVLTAAQVNRPAETDVARVNWLMGFVDWFGRAPITVDEFTFDANGVQMDAVDYRGQTAYDILSDCANQSGKNFYCYTKDNGYPTSEPTRGIWYGSMAHTAYSSPLRLTNVAASVDTPIASYSDMIVADRPVSYWRLGEASGTTAVDAMGVNVGTYVNTPTLGVASLVPTVTDTAVTFTRASTEYVSVADHASLDLGDTVSLEAWIKPTATSLTSVRGIVSKQTGAYYLALNAGRLSLLRSNVAVIVNSTITLVANTTYHVAATKTGATVKLYVNGVDVTGTVTNSTLVNNTDALHIGIDTVAGGHAFDGTIDEVAVYNYALSASQVATHYAGHSTYTDDLWTFAISDDTQLERKADRVYSGAYVRYDGGAVYEQNNTTFNNFTQRDAVVEASNVKSSGAATRRANRYLADLNSEEDRITTKFYCPAAKVNFVKPGMRIQFQSSHFTGYESYRWCRVLSKQTAEVAEHESADPKYLVTLVLAGDPGPPEVCGDLALTQTSGPDWTGANTLPSSPTNCLQIWVEQAREFGTPNVPSGFTLVGTAENQGSPQGNAGGVIIAYRVTQAGDTGSVTSANGVPRASVLYEFGGIDTLVDVATGSDQPNASSITSDPVNVSAAQALIIGAFIKGAHGPLGGNTLPDLNISAPAIRDFDEVGTLETHDQGPTLVVGYRLVTGASGSYTMTATGDSTGFADGTWAYVVAGFSG